MIRRQLPAIILLAMACGVFVSFAYINPHGGQISLSEAILQLSGARGNIQLGVSLNELLSYSAKLLPCFLFESFVGTSFYRHFCTASVYVFTRTPNRLCWYGKECLKMAVQALLFQCVLLTSAVTLAGLRYTLFFDAAEVRLLGIHIVLYTLWMSAMTMLINVLSLTLGSEAAFAIAIGGQGVLITLLATLRALENNAAAYSLAIRLNPISRLVLGWLTVGVEANRNGVVSIGTELSLPASFAYIAGITAFVVIIGGVVVDRHDLLVSDAEFGGM